MSTTNDAIAAIQRRIGIPKSRGVTVARRLTEHGLLPAGSPGKSPELRPEHFVNLIIALASEAPLSRVADAVAQYRVLGLPGHDATGMPASLRQKFVNAGDSLEILAEMELTGGDSEKSTVNRCQIEIVSSFPEVAIHYGHGETERFQPAGTLHGHWQASGHRRSTTIAGAAFAGAVRDLKFGE